MRERAAPPRDKKATPDERPPKARRGPPRTRAVSPKDLERPRLEGPRPEGACPEGAARPPQDLHREDRAVVRPCGRGGVAQGAEPGRHAARGRGRARWGLAAGVPAQGQGARGALPRRPAQRPRRRPARGARGAAQAHRGAAVQPRDRGERAGGRRRAGPAGRRGAPANKRQRERQGTKEGTEPPPRLRRPFGRLWATLPRRCGQERGESSRPAPCSRRSRVGRGRALGGNVGVGGCLGEGSCRRDATYRRSENRAKRAVKLTCGGGGCLPRSLGSCSALVMASCIARPASSFTVLLLRAALSSGWVIPWVLILRASPASVVTGVAPCGARGCRIGPLGAVANRLAGVARARALRYAALGRP